jgi:hypothetical protein
MSLLSCEAGDLGGQMVRNMCPGRIAKFDRNSRTTMGCVQKVEYIVAITA